ncbi:MAG: hypothetical protein ABN482_16280 [Corticimicrobacter sp.]|uniref:hypothetical protein n=1 Tax=Corticimicrobacter sp. TaxID=2678536 RepID=UPI0032DA8A1B
MTSKLLLAFVACLLLGALAACAGRGPARMFERTVQDRFGSELQVLSLRKLGSSEPLARWKGVYGLYVRDRADGEPFMVRLTQDDSAETLVPKVEAARREKNAFVRQQRDALASLRAAGLQGDFFSLKADSAYGKPRWNIAYFADMGALRHDQPLFDAAMARGLAGVMRAGLQPPPQIDIYPASARADYADPLGKGYHGPIELIRGTPQTYMESQDDGSTALWYLDDKAVVAPHIVSERQPALRTACYGAIDAMRARNAFFVRDGFYIVPSGNLYRDYGIPDRLRASGLRQGHTSFGLLDRIDGHMVLRGIVTQDAPGLDDPYAVEAVYEYEYAFATDTLQVRRLTPAS